MKKLMIAALAVMTVSGVAGAKVLWTGTAAFADWQLSAGERPVFAASEFVNSKAGDKVIVSCTNNEADVAQSWHQVELWSANVGIEGQESHPVTNAGIQVTTTTTEVEIVLTDVMLDRIKEYDGCALAGTGYVATKVELTESDGVVWEGTCVCISWDANPPVHLTGDSFALAKEGDKLTFDIAPITMGAYSAIQIDNGTTYSAGSFGTVVLDDATTSISIPLTAALLDELKTYGINITGMNFVLTKIYLVGASADDPVIGENNIWNGNLVVGNWTPYLEVPASKFGKVEPGDGLLFTVAEVPAEGGSICLKEYADGWPELPADADWGNYLAVAEGQTQATFNINAEAANALVQLGLVVTGSYYTLTSIDLVKGGFEGVDAVLNNETAAKAPVYNIMGVKVAENASQITTPGLYISAGKKFIVR